MKRERMTQLVLAVLLVVVIMMGATWAYLSATTDTLTNTFTFLGSDGIDAELTEPAWDPENAKNLTPGAEIPKDPQVTNTGKIDEYVGVKLEFKTGATRVRMTQAQMTKLLGMITFQYHNGTTYVNGFNPAWSLNASSTANAPVQTFNYRFVNGGVAAPLKAASTTPVVAAETTAPLFDRIVIKSTVTQAQLAWLNGSSTDTDKLVDGFDIVITGVGIQASLYNPLVAAGDAGSTALALAIYNELNP